MRNVVLAAVMSALALPAQAQTTVAGPTPGSFRVTESGAAEYRIPIRVPPGIGGMEPKLALVYNSQSGNGLLGVGWNLEGLSAITRCPRTMAQDGVRGGINYDSNDRYCLDGQRLMAIAGTYGAEGTEYRTERESFSRIVSFGQAGSGPAWFKVWTKSGQILEYGRTIDSRIEAQGKASVRVWAVNRMSDTTSNYLAVTYVVDDLNGDYSPLRVDYTGNSRIGTLPRNSVQWTYESRPDAAVAYLGGSVAKRLTRVASVNTYGDGALVESYPVTYGAVQAGGRSRLASIADCMPGNACLPPSVFGYSAGGNDLAPPAWLSTGTHYNGGEGSLFKVIEGDFNGDGKTDLVHVRTNESILYFLPYLSDGSGGFAPGPSYWTGTHYNGGESTLFTVLAADLNGDGLTDLVHVRTNNGILYFLPYLSHGSGGFVAAPSYWTNTHYNGTESTLFTVLAADLDGDGRTDLVHVRTDGNVLYFLPYLSDGNGGFVAVPSYWTNTHYNGTESTLFTVLAADLNGDGMTDLVHARTNDNVLYFLPYLSNGSGGFAAAPAYWTNTHYNGGESTLFTVLAADLNGDGLTDLVHARTNDNVLYFLPYLSDGSGGFVAAPSYWTNTSYNGGEPTLFMVLPADLDGDGRTDLVHVRTNSGELYFLRYLSDGSGGFVAAPSHWTGTHYNGGEATLFTVIAGDINGDAKADLIHARTNVNILQFTSHCSSTPPADLLTSASNGASTTTVQYRATTDPATYSKDPASAYPIVSIQPSLHVVRSIDRSDGVGGGRTSTFAYGGLKLDRNGRGMLGFRWMDDADSATGITMRGENRQDWPYVGLPSLVRKTQSSGAVLGQTLNTYGSTNPATGVHFPFISQSVETGNDLNGTALPTVTTDTSYDAYGNPASIKLCASDGYSKTTTNTFADPDLEIWLLGLLMRSTVQSPSPIPCP
jgi:hypothetical protein